MTTAILIVGHGSRVDGANRGLHQLAAMVREGGGHEIVEVAFREQASPDIQAGIDRCVARGAGRVLLCPYFLFAGAHVLEDLPEELERAGARHPGVEMELAAPLGIHPKLGEVLCERISEGLAAAGWSGRADRRAG